MVLFCAIPMTKTLHQTGALKDKTINRLNVFALIIHGVIGVIVWSCLFVFASWDMITGFVSGFIIVLIISRGRLGMTATNVADFLETHAARIQQENKEGIIAKDKMKTIKNDKNISIEDRLVEISEVSAHSPNLPDSLSVNRKREISFFRWLRYIVITGLGMFFLLVTLGFSTGYISISKDSTSTERTTVTEATTLLQPTIQPTTMLEQPQIMESDTEYKASCKALSYKSFLRLPDNYIGQRVKIEGKVNQIMKSATFEALMYEELTYVVHVTRDKYGYWSDEAYVYFSIPSGHSRILNNDIVTFYGECLETTNKPSIYGYTEIVPFISTLLQLKLA
jgi:hypothetical protein